MTMTYRVLFKGQGLFCGYIEKTIVFMNVSLEG